jgi:hypothetical protein
VEIIGTVAFFSLSAWFFFVWKERQQLRKHNVELKRELTRAIAQRDPWYEEESELFSRAA